MNKTTLVCWWYAKLKNPQPNTQATRKVPADGRELPVLCGKVVGHSSVPDGHRVITSDVVEVVGDRPIGSARQYLTWSDNLYELCGAQGTDENWLENPYWALHCTRVTEEEFNELVRQNPPKPQL
jgi:hypothetical protein